MKIVIDIDDMAYKFVQDTSFVEDESTMFKQTNADRKKTLLLFDILNAIKNGTPLPKGHGRIMDVDKIIKKMEEREEYLKDIRSMYETACVETALDMFGETIIEADKAESEDKYGKI